MPEIIPINLVIMRPVNKLKWLFAPKLRFGKYLNKQFFREGGVSVGKTNLTLKMMKSIEQLNVRKLNLIGPTSSQFAKLLIARFIWQTCPGSPVGRALVKLWMLWVSLGLKLVVLFGLSTYVFAVHSRRETPVHKD